MVHTGQTPPPPPPPPGGSPKPPETTVSIDTPGVTVTITTAGQLDQVAAKALELFHAAGGWPQRGSGGGTGFAQVERRETGAAAGSSMWEPMGPVGFGDPPSARSAP